MSLLMENLYVALVFLIAVVYCYVLFLSKGRMLSLMLVILGNFLAIFIYLGVVSDARYVRDLILLEILFVMIMLFAVVGLGHDSLVIDVVKERLSFISRMKRIFIAVSVGGALFLVIALNVLNVDGSGDGRAVSGRNALSGSRAEAGGGGEVFNPLAVPGHAVHFYVKRNYGGDGKAGSNAKAGGNKALKEEGDGVDGSNGRASSTAADGKKASGFGLQSNVLFLNFSDVILIFIGVMSGLLFYGRSRA